MVTRVVRQLLWQRGDRPGLEHFRLSDSADGPVLEGTVLTVPDGEPLRVDYEIRCTAAWVTRRARIDVWLGAVEHRLELVVDDRGRWWRDGHEVPALAGCVDIDLSVTPSTNTLPIRRLAMRVGEEREVPAAWVRVPDLAMEVLEQRYVRIAEHEYRYESGGGAFTAVMTVDELGLVVRYPPVWARVEGRGPA